MPSYALFFYCSYAGFGQLPGEVGISGWLGTQTGGFSAGAFCTVHCFICFRDNSLARQWLQIMSYKMGKSFAVMVGIMIVVFPDNLLRESDNQ